MQPSTFATRKAAADLANAARSKRRLVSLGPSKFRQRTTDGNVEFKPVELFTDLDSGERFVHFQGTAALVPLQAEAQH